MKILLTDRIHESGMDRLAERFDVVVAPDTSKATIRKLIPDALAVITRLTAIDRELIEAGQGLVAIGRHGVGVDNIDMTAARERGITVITTGEANSTAVAEHAMFAIGALLRHILVFDAEVRSGNWGIRDQLRGTEAAGKSLGILGLGSIGLRLARIATEGFGMRVHWHDLFVTDTNRQAAERLGAIRHDDLDAMLPHLDVLSVHVPLTESTRGLIDADRLQRLPAGAIVVNFARGGIVQEDALVDALDSGHLRGAALDVFEDEPVRPDAPYLRYPNRILLSPHTAFLTDESLEKMSLTLAHAITDAVTAAERKRVAR